MANNCAKRLNRSYMTFSISSFICLRGGGLREIHSEIWDMIYSTQIKIKGGIQKINFLNEAVKGKRVIHTKS